MQAAKITIIGLIVLVSLFLGFLGYQYIQILNTPVQASTETTTSQKTTTGTTGSGSTSQSTTSGTTSTTTGTSGSTSTTSGSASTTTPTTTSSAKTTSGTTSTTGSGSTTTGTTSGTSQKTSTTGTTSGTTSTSSAGSTTTSGFYKDGVYTGNGNGKTQGMKVQVVVSGGKINGVSVLTSRDDQPYLNEAISGLVPRIIAAQSTSVDTVSGATLSSKGILQGAAAALAQAK